MPTFVYKGRNRLNELVSGEREAATQDELRGPRPGGEGRGPGGEGRRRPQPPNEQ